MSFGRHGSGCNARVEEFWGNLQDMKKRGFNRNGVIKKVLGGVVGRRGEPILLALLHAVREKNVGGPA